MTSLLDSLALNLGRTLTENGAVTNASTVDANLDFFGVGGALRGRTDEFIRLFRLAYAEDKLLAVRTLFYLRDIRGGQGERDLFRAGFNTLRTLDRKNWVLNIINTPYFGRWDDLFDGVPFDPAVIEVITDQLAQDTVMMSQGKPVSLLAKWLPSENASSTESKEKARQLAKSLGISPREYRKTVVSLRKYIGLLETKMTEKDWDRIDYGVVPSQALRKHVKAFRRNDNTRYEAFLDAVDSGEKKINTSTLFTYEIYDMIPSHYNYTNNHDERTANTLWANLPDWTDGKNAIVVADVSGSMTGRPMSVSVSLAMYFAERNVGPFNGYFITFSESPKLVKVLGDTLSERINNISSADWGMNTDVKKVFQAILKAAQTNGASADDIPKTIYIISDMEFDGSVRASDTIFEEAKRNYEAAGFTLPHIVFWNVNARNTQFPATKFDGNVSLFSGLNQSIFQHAVAGKTPLETMVDVLSSERYSRVDITA